MFKDRSLPVWVKEFISLYENVTKESIQIDTIDCGSSKLNKQGKYGFQFQIKSKPNVIFQIEPFATAKSEAIATFLRYRKEEGYVPPTYEGLTIKALKERLDTEMNDASRVCSYVNGYNDFYQIIPSPNNDANLFVYTYDEKP